MGRVWIKTIFAMLMIGMISSAHAQLDNPNSFSFDGRLLDDSTGNPMSGPRALKVQVYNPAANCLLFEEDHASVPLDADGAFSIRVGTGTRNTGADGGLSWKSIFSNKGVLIRASNGGTCGTSYTPSPGDSRKIRITVDSVNVLTPDFTMTTVPFATTADTLQGLAPTDLVLASGGSAVNGFIKMNNQAAVRFADAVGTNYVAVRAPGSVSGAIEFVLPGNFGAANQVLATDGAGNLTWTSTVPSATQIQNQQISTVAPSNGQVLAWNGSTAKWEGKTFAASSNATQIQSYNVSAAAPSNGQVLTFNGSQWTPMNVAGSGGGGTVTFITAGVGLIGGPITTSGSLSVDTGTSANKIVQLNGSAQLPAVDGSLLVNLDAAKIATRPVSPAVPSANQVLTWNGSVWMPMTIAGTGGGGGTVSAVALGTGLIGGVITNTGTVHVDVGTTANKILQLNGSAQVPAVDGGLLTNVSATKISGNPVVAAAPSFNHALIWNGSAWMSQPNSASLLQGSPVSGVAPSTGQILKFNGGVWDLASDAGSVFPLMSTVSGSGALPAFSFQSDPNTGVFNPVADTFSIATGGIEQIRVTSSGNVGVGTISPSAKMEVNGGASPLPFIVANTSGSSVGMAFAQSGTDKAYFDIDTIAGDIMIDAGGDFSYEFRIASSGRFGFGTMAPVSGAIAEFNGVGPGLSSIVVPRDSTANRPSVGVNGMIRYNTSSSKFEAYESGQWVKFVEPIVSVYAGRSLNGSLGLPAFSTSTTYYSATMGPNEMQLTDVSGVTSSLVPRAGTIKNLRVKMNTAPGSSWVYTIVRNQTDTGITCTVTSALTSCNDIVNAVNVAPDDEVGLKLVTGATGASSRVNWAFELVSP